MSRRDDLVKKIHEYVYLGDGLYASFDGHKFKLSTPQNQVFLATWVMNNLDHYRKSIRALLKELQNLGEE